MRSFVALLVIVFLALVLFSGAVFAEMIDVVYLKNGSVIKGMVTEIIPSETIKIETTDGSVFVYQFDEIDKMTKTGIDAVAKIVDVVHLKNGSIIKGVVTEIIPSETAKIETADGNVFVYQFDEIQSITKEEKVEVTTESIGKVTTTPKNPLVALGSGCGVGCLSGFLPGSFPLVLGVGQFYNGEYTKGLIFLGVGAYATYDFYNIVELGASATDTEVMRGLLDLTLIGGSIIWSAFDAYYSAKRINLEASKEKSSTSLNYIPHQGLMASYSMRF